MNGKLDQTAPATPGIGRPSPTELLVPTTVNGRYRVTELLGKGGMGVVYRATDAVRGRDVALKMLRGEGLNTTSLGLFKAEFMTLGTLHHPNIAAVYDFARRQGTRDFFFTMELIAGQNALKATEHASLPEILGIGLQVLRALAYLHTREVIHLDLKPANILVSMDERVRLVDFGIASSTYAQANGRYATPLYMAPELLREGAEIDRRADLYSLGVTLFELVFRRFPSAGALFEVSDSSRRGSFALSEAELRRVPGWLPGILRRLIASDPAERFRTANEVIAAINEARDTSDAIETEETSDSYVASAALVGRNDELEALLDFVYQRMTSGVEGPIAVLCQGPSGAGKSRLLHEVRRQCQLARYFFLDGQCYGDALEPYVAWETIVAQAAALIAPAIEPHAAVVHAVSPALAARVGLAAEPRKLGADRLAQCLVELLLAAGESCVVSVADLQWIDPASLELLELVLERCADLQRERPVRVAFLLSAREDLPDPLERTLRRLRSTQTAFSVAPPPLDAPQVGELVASMLGTTDIAQSLSEALARATGGNAMLVTEVMRAWVKDGSLVPQASGWTFRRRPSAAEIALQLTHVLSDRLAELSRQELQALRSLAVFGRPLSLALLGALLEADRETVLAVLSELRHKRFVFVSGDERVHFSAARWGESIRETMEPSVRAELHCRLAELLAHSADAPLVAFHYECGANAEAAAKWYCRAAANSFFRGELKPVLDYAEKSRTCGADGIALGQVCSMAAEAARLCGDKRAESFAQRALSLLPPGSIEWIRASRVAIAVFNPFLNPS